MNIIARIKGGLGNQLYCYAAARRLAVENNVDLIIDDQSGFKRDYKYQRKYTLDHFNLPCRKANYYESLKPFERIRRGLFKKIERYKAFESRQYIEQEFDDFDSRLLDVRISKTTYIDGLWQSLKYFEDIETVIRKDLEIAPPEDEKNLNMSKEIDAALSVAVHVRWFDTMDKTSTVNTDVDYYTQSVEYLEKSLNAPHYFVFSDNLEAAKKNINFPKERVTFISHNTEEKDAIWDFWLMRQCKHFIIANSTFSWWAAWLSQPVKDKIVLFPRLSKDSKTTWAWDYEGQMPKKWHPIVISS